MHTCYINIIIAPAASKAKTSLVLYHISTPVNSRTNYYLKATRCPPTHHQQPTISVLLEGRLATQEVTQTQANLLELKHH